MTKSIQIPLTLIMIRIYVSPLCITLICGIEGTTGGCVGANGRGGADSGIRRTSCRVW